jgi:outer membrane receptor protein involved in Fe transport
MKTQKRHHLSKGYILLLSAVLALAISVEATAEEQKDTDLAKLSIEELMNIEVASAATLTETKPRLVPAAITTVTQEDIKASGARSLYELLDIYVPNLEWLRSHWENDVMGLRGIVGDRNDKYLLLVNGRNMNQRTHLGALSEQDLVLLRDIHHIDIVRGPGSALYGPGAVSMVINIVTFDGETYRGTEVVSRLGAVEEFYSAEIKHGQAFDDNEGGVFIYAGIGKYVGADKYDAPHTYPFTFPTASDYTWWDPSWGTWPETPPPYSLPADGTEAGEPMRNAPICNDGADPRDLPSIKLHVQITRDNWDIWARYTRGGKEFSYATGSLARDRWGWADWPWWDTATLTPKPWVPNFYCYQQATGYVGHKQELTNNLDIDYAFSYNLFDFDKSREGTVFDAYREDNYYGKALLKWQPNDRHRVAFGGEISHLELGLKGLGWPDLAPRAQPWQMRPYPESPLPMPRWSTNMYSLLGEWQWNISDKWTTFVGSRLDDHTYTGWMFSPRAAIVHTPTDKDTLKLMWSRSVRANVEEQMRAKHNASGKRSDPEKLDSVELRYERMHNKNLDLAASLFVHYNLEAIVWNNNTWQSELAGTQKEYGIDLEASYHTEKTRLTISHGYTKLYDFDLEPGQSTYITAEPYGYGDDLANWANHITKLTAQHKLNDQWTFDATLRIYWGFPGRKDFDEYYPYSGSDGAGSGLYPGGSPYYPHSIIEEGWERAYRGSYYLNMGLQYKPSNDLTIGLTGYNLLGIFNKDFNKRNYMDVVSSGDFRSHAPAVGVSVEYKF